ncbi:Concanavalin A-like lectin/glucanases superfamily protein [Flavobacterium sp. CF108]|uniref:LamG domain-containing protein n=1 Tax=unclassified Flavobacterium TaxID=196869 RepID=UPI0008D13932|nr:MULTISPECIES: LamG domain-containing protein [unclassified Flavobacterium]SEO88266.1 Concanavalin A-like lectin/glucanases superfamily protein [Flavobacterium sp. fv08]SHG66954.1 Concanavalin A-like lectin/glucanases superfamily protein [Flavobacterium sp. CF108]
MKKFLLSVMFVSYLNATAQNPIQEFNFNGTLNNESNTISFMGSNDFVPDRSGIAGNAQRLNNKALEAVVDDLPQGNKARTVSIWVKFNDIASANYIWGYGSAYNAQYFGLLQQSTVSSNSDLSLAGWGATNDVIVSTSLAKGVWYQYTVTFDGTVSKMYRNGELLKYINGLKRSTKGTIFRLGEINTSVGINADVDDLKIYDIALTDEQVAESYNSSKPLIVAAEVTAAPKAKGTVVKSKTAKTPSSNIIVNKDVNVGGKNIEVYSQGQKVVGDNSMTINDLPEGTYLLKISNASAKKITSK